VDHHKRFVDMAREVKAGENQEAFDRAFSEVVKASATLNKSA